jgi:hypothetical protein
MKKIIALLLSVGAVATSFAQYNHHDNDDRNYRDRDYRNENNWDDYNATASNRDNREWRHFDRGNTYSARMRDFQIEKINREFDLKIEAIRCDPDMRPHAKRRAIRYAQIERSRRIQFVNESFNHNKHWNY